MSSGKKLGTLVVVVLKARNLKDSHTFYKQDPYAVLRLGGTEKKTSVDPRGGQHPVWDDELHFPVLECVPGSDSRTLSVAAYSKESKVDELIGEGKVVDISDTIAKGEFDDWVKLQLKGAYRGEIYLEMTYYSAAPPPSRRPSKLSPKDRLLRPPATPPKETTSPHTSLQRSPQLRASSNTNNSPRIHPHILSPSPQPYPAVSSTSSSPRHGETLLPAVPRAGSTSPRYPYVDPTLKNIPYLEMGPSAYDTSPTPAPAPALYSVPSILRPRNIKSSPIPVPARDIPRPPPPPKDKLDDPNRRFQRELAESDAEFATRLAEREGIDVERLKVEEADAELAKRLASEEHGGIEGQASISVTVVRGPRAEEADAQFARRLFGEEHAEMGETSIPGGWIESN